MTPDTAAMALYVEARLRFRDRPEVRIYTRELSDVGRVAVFATVAAGRTVTVTMPTALAADRRRVMGHAHLLRLRWMSARLLRALGQAGAAFERLGRSAEKSRHALAEATTLARAERGGGRDA